MRWRGKIASIQANPVLHPIEVSGKLPPLANVGILANIVKWLIILGRLGSQS